MIIFRIVFAAFLSLGLCSCMHAASPVMNDHRGKSILAILNDHYVYPDRVAEVADAIRSRSAGLRDLDDKAYANAMRKDLSELVGDRHLLLDFSGRALLERGNLGSSQAEGDAQKRLEAFAKRVSYGIPDVKVLDNNIGYLRIDGFLPVSAASAALEKAIGQLRDTRALVIDLRESDKGGEPEMVALICAYLVPDPGRLLTRTVYRSGEVEESRMPIIDAARRYPENTPVYVLTSSKTFSAGEELAYNLKVLGRARLIGEATGGGANPGNVHRVADHLRLFVPDGEVFSAVTGRNWNWNGVIPHEAVAPAIALERVLDLIATDQPN